MRWRWMPTWLLCAALTAGLIVVWRARPEDIGNAASLAGAVVGLFGVRRSGRGRPGPRFARSSSRQVDEAAQVFARLVLRQWQDEAVLRQLSGPAPLPVVWSDSALRDVSDHRELTGDPVTCGVRPPPWASPPSSAERLCICPESSSCTASRTRPPGGRRGPTGRRSARGRPSCGGRATPRPSTT
ncbi:hypothetical protein ADK76_15970 [Streptomyces griseoflavus]|uniref:hypothetical protein n=1 Tax=Streptomyces rimosus TaxID=1927 RepID=UPI0004CC127F|nr:hypothetical protein [Streptomyces rimosus]KOG59649.1 hypothetical protein ADK76_15970 [Streptomyces griseoflavus]